MDLFLHGKFDDSVTLTWRFNRWLIDNLNAIGLQHDQAVQAAQDWPGWQRRISDIGQTRGHNVSSRFRPE